MIPEAAVEAAARAVYLTRVNNIVIPQRKSEYQAVARRDARVALEAAAPYLLADAWDEGAKANSDHEYQCRFKSNYGDDLPEPPANPYRIERKTTILRLFEPGAKWEEL